MTRYFFDVRNNGTIVLDEAGLELDDVGDAVGEAARSLVDMASDMVEGSLHQQLTIEIRGAWGEASLEVTLTLRLYIPRANGD